MILLLISGSAVSVAKYMSGVAFFNNVNSITEEDDTTEEDKFKSDNNKQRIGFGKFIKM